MGNIFTSSLGKKIIMSAAGLFLILYLPIHLGINFLVVIFEETRNFNVAAHFMASNLVIRVMEIVLFSGFLLHIIYGVILQFQNWLARPVRYKETIDSETSWFSKFMIHTGIIILIFLVIHLVDFYFVLKIWGEVETVLYDGKEYHDLGSLVLAKFKLPGFVIFYIISFIFLGFHLIHGFHSAFQSIGFNRKKFLNGAKIFGYVYTFIIVGGYTAIPLIIYFMD